MEDKLKEIVDSEGIEKLETGDVVLAIFTEPTRLTGGRSVLATVGNVDDSQIELFEYIQNIDKYIGWEFSKKSIRTNSDGAIRVFPSYSHSTVYYPKGERYDEIKEIMESAGVVA